MGFLGEKPTRVFVFGGMKTTSGKEREMEKFYSTFLDDANKLSLSLPSRCPLLIVTTSLIGEPLGKRAKDFDGRQRRSDEDIFSVASFFLWNSTQLDGSGFFFMKNYKTQNFKSLNLLRWKHSWVLFHNNFPRLITEYLICIFFIFPSDSAAFFSWGERFFFLGQTLRFLRFVEFECGAFRLFYLFLFFLGKMRFSRCFFCARSNSRPTKKALEGNCWHDWQFVLYRIFHNWINSKYSVSTAAFQQTIVNRNM